MDYVQCCVSGCSKNPCVGVKTTTHMLYYCENHVLEGLRARQSIVKGTNPAAIPWITPKRLELLGRGSRNNKKKKRVVASKTWSWIDKFDFWRNAAGKQVRIQKLDTDELVDAIVAISSRYIGRYTAKTAWIKDLYLGRKQIYVYPADKFTVEKSDALAKLDELYEEARFRGLV